MMSRRSDSMLSRTGASPTRSATSIRIIASCLSGVNSSGVRTHSCSARRPLSVSSYTVRSVVRPGSLRVLR